MTLNYASPTNVYLPTHEATGRLVVGYSRNEKDQALNQVVKRVNCTAKNGFYLKFNPLDYNRLPAGGDYRDSAWAPGNPRPKNTMNNLGFEWKEYRTFRRNESVSLDSETIDLATWDIMANHTDALAQLAMTKRTIQVSGVGFDSTQYAASHTDTATNIGGGFFSAGTATAPYIKVGLNFAARKILVDTNGTITPDMLGIWINPNTAHKMGQSQEIHSYVKESPFAAEMLQAKGNLNAMFNLPTHLYGYKVTVDISTYNAFNRGNASEAQAFVVPDNKILMYVREAKFDGSPNTGSYSTLGLFVYEPNDMKVEAFTNTEDRFTNLHVVDETDCKVLSPESGYLITSVFS